jgi:hypothetical protein
LSLFFVDSDYFAINITPPHAFFCRLSTALRVYYAEEALRFSFRFQRYSHARLPLLLIIFRGFFMPLF